MTVPLTLHPRQDTVEGMQFTGGIESANDLAKWLGVFKDQPPRIYMTYTSSINELPRLELGVGEDEYELSPGDWVIKDGELFSVVRRRDLPFRYVTGIEKVLIEAGMN